MRSPKYLSELQIEFLCLLKESKTLSYKSYKYKPHTTQSLDSRGLILSRRYANGLFWELTDAGIEALEELDAQGLKKNKIGKK